MSISETGDGYPESLAAQLASRLVTAGHRLTALEYVNDTDLAICNQVQVWLDAGNVDVILTTDDSVTSIGGPPPQITLCDDVADHTQLTTLLHDRNLGFIGVINLKTAPQKSVDALLDTFV